MRYFLQSIWLLAGLALLCVSSRTMAQTGSQSTSRQLSADQIQFNRDIRPLLSDRCFLCHGPDQSSEQAAETDLRLDDRTSALDFDVFDFEEVDSSEIILRITSDDESDRMPPPGSHRKPFTDSEIDLIRKWINQGAAYEKHWSYIPPRRPDVPVVENMERVGNPVDAFVLRRLQDLNVQPAKLADRETLIRRVSLDLTGLPPDLSDVDAFVADPKPLREAFESVVDRLLASPQYGEHMARFWLDAARYADTGGYQYDRERKQWVWRDWVIHSFNTNQPFDQFTIEQIAGDLLPDATDQTRLATGFNRNHPVTIEGGVVDEEYRTEYVIDRVVTTSTVWLGQTFLCARCHDHKYDPVSQKEFYQFFSFFNNVPERGLNGFDPRLTLPSPLATGKIESLVRQVTESREKIGGLQLPVEKWEEQLANELSGWLTPELVSVQSSGGSSFNSLEDGSLLVDGVNPAKDDYEILVRVDQPIRVIRLEALTHQSLTNGSASRGTNGNFVLTEFVVESASSEKPDQFRSIRIESANADYEQKGFSINAAFDGKTGSKGWAVDGNTNPGNRTAIFALAEPVEAGSMIRIRMLHRYGSSHQIGRFRLSFSPDPLLATEVVHWLSVPPNERDQVQSSKLTRVLAERFGNSATIRLLDEYEHRVAMLESARSFPQTMVMSEMSQPRTAYVLERGEYDKPRTDEPLDPGVPVAIGALDPAGASGRLGLAQWLVSRDQPLTSRVTVNRFWQQLFGVGLVKTAEDFGSQGEYPRYPGLLDWLAVEFMENGWNVKQLMKTIVMSNTYQQSSHSTQQVLASDPENRWLARGPRFRLDGETIRDNALAVSGLLNPAIGGASVYPYHPYGLWMEINNRPNYSRPYPHQLDASQHHRRSMYTFWKRSVPPPSIASFDAPSREYCVVRRSRTNTPLQAFVMLHDPQFIEAARHLAGRMIREGGDSAESRIEFGFRLCTSRKPGEKELKVLVEALGIRIPQYQANSDAVQSLLSVGVTPVDDDIDPVQLAAFTQIARMLMNLSEFITRG